MLTYTLLPIFIFFNQKNVFVQKNYQLHLIEIEMFGIRDFSIPLWNDIFPIIFGYLNLKDIIKFRRISKKIKNCITNFTVCHEIITNRFRGNIYKNYYKKKVNTEMDFKLNIFDILKFKNIKVNNVGVNPIEYTLFIQNLNNNLNRQCNSLSKLILNFSYVNVFHLKFFKSLSSFKFKKLNILNVELYPPNVDGKEEITLFDTLMIGCLFEIGKIIYKSKIKNVILSKISLCLKSLVIDNPINHIFYFEIDEPMTNFKFIKCSFMYFNHLNFNLMKNVTFNLNYNEFKSKNYLMSICRMLENDIKITNIGFNFCNGILIKNSLIYSIFENKIKNDLKRFLSNKHLRTIVLSGLRFQYVGLKILYVMITNYPKINFILKNISFDFYNINFNDRMIIGKCFEKDVIPKNCLFGNDLFFYHPLYLSRYIHGLKIRNRSIKKSIEVLKNK